MCNSFRSRCTTVVDELIDDNNGPGRAANPPKLSANRVPDGLFLAPTRPRTPFFASQPSSACINRLLRRRSMRKHGNKVAKGLFLFFEIRPFVTRTVTVYDARRQAY